MKTILLYNLSAPIATLIALLCFAIGVESAAKCGQNKRLSTSKLVCYYSTVEHVDGCYCTHVVLPANSDVKNIVKVKERAKGVKVYVSVNEFNQGLIELLKSAKVDGLELNLKKLDSKNDISDFISTIKTKIASNLDIALSVPAKADLVAKYFDFKALSKHADMFILQTGFLGASTNVTFHPSRLSGMWDMQNTDSVVDLVTGLGAPISKLVVVAPVQGFQFTLQNEKYTAPGSPALEVKSISRTELCKMMHRNSNWTLERDEDQAGPYIFSNNQWIAFEDSKSMDIKAKYSRVRGLAGLALKDLAQDARAECGSTILEVAYNGLSRQARAPRGAVLHSLEREILDSSDNALDSVKLSPYRISRIIDTEGKIHAVRQDSRTEFQCSRQGYFVHPRSCNRFYRCVKFDQLTEDYNVFEFDCPAGLAFDETVEVCVWPGSLRNGGPCSGSSEIAPVPRKRFTCPSEPGYYADPENCRWFFACLDHGNYSLEAYEFRCPFGLVFDSDRLMCEWPWLVPRCASGLGFDSEYYYGGGNAITKGYDLKGYTSPSDTLENYDGLGTLNAVQLGGLSGKYEQPVAAIYSNVGTGGLSYKATHTPQSAGLLQVSDGQGIGFKNQDGSYTSGKGLYLDNKQAKFNSGESYAGADVYQDSFSRGSSTQDANQRLVQDTLIGSQITNEDHEVTGDLSVNSGSYDSEEKSKLFHTHTFVVDGKQYAYQGIKYEIDNDGLLRGSPNLGAVSSQSLTQFHGQKGTNEFGSGTAGTVNIVGGGFSAVGPTIHKPEEGVAFLASGVPAVVPFGNSLSTKIAQVPAVAAVPIPDIKTETVFHTAQGGVIANVPNLQFKVESRDEAGILLKNLSSTHFIQNQQFQQDELDKFQAGLFTVSTPKPFVTVTTGQPEVYVTSTVKPVTDDKLQEEYVPSVTIQPKQVIYSTERPAVSTVSFQKYNLRDQAVKDVVESYSGVSSPKPVVVTQPSFSSTSYPETVHIENVLIQKQPQIEISSTTPSAPTVSTYNYNQRGYVYEKPTIKFEEKPATFQQTKIEIPTVHVATKQKSIVEDYAYQQPTQSIVPLYRQPNLLSTYTYQPPIQKQPVSTYTYQNVAQQAAGLYNKPEYSFVHTSRPLQSYSGGSTYQYFNAENKQQGSVNFQSQAGRYIYSKPSVGFEERPHISVVDNYKFTTPQPAVVVQEGKAQGGYVYEKPVVPFEEGPVTYSTVKPVVVSTYFNTGSMQTDYGENNVKQKNTGYVYQKPAIQFAESPVTYSTPRPVEVHQPSISTSYVNIDNSQEVKVQQENTGYVYQKPAVQFEESPITYTPPRPVIIQKETPISKPAVVSSYFNIANSESNFNKAEENNGYVYQKPVVQFEERPVTYSTPRPVIVQKEISVNPPAVVSSYFNIAGSQNDFRSEGKSGYIYQKPAIEFQEKPVTYSTPKPAVWVQEQSPVNKPTVVSSYFNIGCSQNSAKCKEEAGYDYQKPAVKLEIPFTYSTPSPVAPINKPAVVSTYYNTDNSRTNSQEEGYVYEKPALQFEHQPVIYSTPRTVVVEDKSPAVVTNYFNIGSSQTNAAAYLETHQENTGYVYQKPQVQFKEVPIVYSTPKPVIIQDQANVLQTEAKLQHKNIEYAYQKPVVPFKETPVTYSTPKPIVIETNPAIVSSYFNTGSSRSEQQNQQYYSYNINKGNTNLESDQGFQNFGYTYQKPSVKFEEIPVTYTTQKPIVESSTPALVNSYFNIGSTTSKGYEYPKPSVYFEEEPLRPVTEGQFVKKTAYVTGGFQQNSQQSYNYQQDYHQNYQQNGKVVVENYQNPAYRYQPKVVYNYVQSTPKPTFESTIGTIAKQRLQPVSPAIVTSYDSRYTSTPVPSTITPDISSTRGYYQYKSTTEAPQRSYLPVTSTVRITTPLPKITKGKVIESYIAPEVTTLSRDYLPVKVKTEIPARDYLPVRISTTTASPEITTLSREYLPAKTRQRITTTDKQVYTVRPRIRPSTFQSVRPVTVIKKNDLHPLLSAKLGAQCTCVSNTLKLRRKQKIIVVEDEDSDDDDGYAVADGQGNVESYRYEPQKVADVTPVPEVYIKSSTIEPQTYIRKRVKVHPASVQESITKVSNAFYESGSQNEDIKVSDGEIVKAVRTGLKLVKQAAKEGAKEGTQEVLSNQLDRYGHGGVRSRTETLQGTIDCQRAGLFRHPTQCNKFYSCRWDCTKKRFTLHVFNCPVHLTFDNSLGACNWPSQGPACVENTLITSD